MSISNLFRLGHHTRNLAHFSSLVNIAAVDGKLTKDEEILINRMAVKLNISESDFEEIMKDPTKHPVKSSNSVKERLERIHDLFSIVFSDHRIDEKEYLLIRKYAIGLGYCPDEAEELIENSINIYTGKITFEEYKYLLKRRTKKD